MKDLRVITVCGAGVGTSTLLRINVDDAFKSFKLPFYVSVSNTSMSRAKGTPCDVVFTFASFADEARAFCDNVVVINNLMDKAELKTKVAEYLKSNNLIKEE